ncbi:MAG: MFS transporter [Elainellaceae cyanobacterium]
MSESVEKQSALLVVTLTSFSTPFMLSSINIALPVIGNEFNLAADVLSWVATSYLLASAIFLLPFGKLADMYGRKKIYTYGVVFYTIFCTLLSLCNSGSALIGLRFFQGIGSAMIFSTGVAILTSIFPAQERGKVLGINVASVYLGLSFGPFLGGLLTENFGWRSIFLTNIPMGLLILYLLRTRLKGEWASARGERFDWLGAIIYGTSLVAVIYGFSLLPSLTGTVLIGLGSLGTIAFVQWEKRSKSPMLDIRLFHNPVFALSNLAALINYSATFAVSFLLSLYLQYVKELSPQQAGLVLVAQPIVQTFFSPIAGRMSDTVEPRLVASAGMTSTALGLLFFTSLTATTSLAFIIFCLVFLGFGFALFSSPNTNAIMSSIDRQFYGVASATMATMRLVGQVLSMGIATLVFVLYVGRIEITPDSYPSFLAGIKTIFMIFTTLCFVGIFASLARGKVR